MISPAATPTRTEKRPGERAYQEAFAREFVNGDREAYRRLRQEGLQPPRIAGSAELEAHAETRYEVETGRIIPDGERKNYRDALSVCDDAGFDPFKPALVEKKGN